MSGWTRVAAGLQLVAEAAAKQAAQDAGKVASRAARHGAQVVQSTRTAAAASGQQVWQQTESMASSLDDLSSQSLNGLTNEGFTSPSHKEAPTTSSSPPETMAGHSLQSTERHMPPMQNSESSFDANTQSTSQEFTLENAGEQTPENLVATENTIRTTEDKSQRSQALQEDIQRLKEGSAIPSTRVGRAWGFAQLGLGLATGTARAGLSRLFGGSTHGGIVNDANADLLAASLCRMRGAALKMGQMLSIQDESLLPPALARALHQVRQGADAMPNYQLIKQLESQLGKDWRNKFESFVEIPFAAASIGQVHRATIRRGNEIQDVVVKVQYPGVGRSIESDLRNLSMLVTWTGLAPKGLFIENVIRVGQKELKVECDYVQEKKNQKRIKQLVESDPILQQNRFVVPDVIDGLTAEQLITSEYRPGGTIDKVAHLDQEERNRIGRTILYLTMKELFDWRFMQTDPNWGNFLYDVNTRTTSLIDFGATREYSKEFVDGYIRIVWASANRDEKTLMEQSHRMKFLTGEENEQMIHAHKMSGFTVGEPFFSDEPFDFRGSNISTRMGEQTSVFLKHRLTAPPEEVYTLHRKLAGAYMLCIKLGAVVRCRDMLEDIVANHEFQDGMDPPIIHQTSQAATG